MHTIEQAEEIDPYELTFKYRHTGYDVSEEVNQAIGYSIELEDYLDWETSALKRFYNETMDEKINRKKLKKKI